MATQMMDVTLPGPGPFGFRLAGGRDFNTPIHISKTTPNGKAGWAGLQVRDVVASINGHITSSLSHFEAQDIVMQCSGDLQLRIRRGGQWVQSPTQSKPGGEFPSAPPPVRRLEPEPMAQPAAPAVVHKQFNSPVGLYSADNIADAFKGQIEGMGIEAGGVKLPATPMSPLAAPGGPTPFGAPPGSYDVLHAKPRPMAQSYIGQQAPRAQTYAPPRRAPPPQQGFRPQQQPYRPPQAPRPHRPPPQPKPAVRQQPERSYSNPGAKSRSFKMLEGMTQEDERRAYEDDQHQQKQMQNQPHPHEFENYDDHLSRGNQSRSFKMLQQLTAEEEANWQDDL